MNSATPDAAVTAATPIAPKVGRLTARATASTSIAGADTTATDDSVVEAHEFITDINTAAAAAAVAAVAAFATSGAGGGVLRGVFKASPEVHLAVGEAFQG